MSTNRLLAAMSGGINDSQNTGAKNASRGKWSENERKLEYHNAHSIRLLMNHVSINEEKMLVTRRKGQSMIDLSTERLNID